MHFAFGGCPFFFPFYLDSVYGVCYNESDQQSETESFMKVYEGTEKYIFVSYARRDAERVLPILEKMDRSGFRIWYDVGIAAGSPSYFKVLEDRLSYCDVVMYFVSEASVSSLYCRREIEYAVRREKTILPVYLEETTLRDGLDFMIGSCQDIRKYLFPSENAFYDKLLHERVLDGCREAPKTVPPAKPTPASIQKNPEPGTVASMAWTPPPQSPKPSVSEKDERYVYIIYSHKDRATVMPLIEGLQCAGVRIWYDQGIEAGTEWPEYIASHIEASKSVLFFVSKNSIESFSCRDEFGFARALEKEILAVYLSDVSMPSGLQMQLSALQSMRMQDERNGRKFLSRLCAHPMLQACKV